MARVLIAATASVGLLSFLFSIIAAFDRNFPLMAICLAGATAGFGLAAIAATVLRTR